MKIETRAIDSLRPDSRNARKHGGRNLATIRASLEQFGQRRAAVVRSDGTVLAGNGMLEAARSLGWSKLSVTVVPDEWSEEQARAYALADNRTGELAEWDVAVLDEHLVELEVAGLDIEALGFDSPERETLSAEEEDVPEPPKDPVSAVGDIWQVGPHRVICGDASDPSVFDLLLKRVRPTALWTDPPYGVSYVGKTKDALTIKNDGKDGLSKLLGSTLPMAFGVLKPGSPWYVAAPPGPQTADFVEVVRHYGWRQTLAWVKSSMVLGHSDYHYKHEIIYFGYTAGGEGRRGRGGSCWYGDNSQTSVLEFDKPGRNKDHPTMKPVELIEYCLSNSTKRGDAVIDLFAGSGSTLVACHRLGRIGYGVELDPAYVDVIVRRLEEATGEKAVRVDG
jgi:DNA modification methylase